MGQDEHEETAHHHGQNGVKIRKLNLLPIKNRADQWKKKTTKKIN